MVSRASRKCERWLVCSCTSYPSAVARSSTAMTPALQKRMCTPTGPAALTSALAAARTEAKDWRSQSMVVTAVDGPLARTAFSAAAARSDGRLSM